MFSCNHKLQIDSKPNNLYFSLESFKYHNDNMLRSDTPAHFFKTPVKTGCPSKTKHYLNYLLLTTLLFWEVDINMLTASSGKEIFMIANVPASGYRPQWGIRPYLK